MDGYPFYLVAQNFKVLSGGVSKANCDKIVKCLDAAEKNSTPVIYILNTLGVQMGEGVTVLEGLGKLLMRSTQLKGVVPQYAVIDGEVYGSAAMLAAIADFSFFIEKKSVLAINSPLVLSAKAGKNLPKEEVGGAKALGKTGIPAFEAKDIAEVKARISAVSELLEMPMIDAELNEAVPQLNEAATAENLAGIFENSVEVGAGYEPEVKTILGRIGGIAVAAGRIRRQRARRGTHGGKTCEDQGFRRACLLLSASLRRLCRRKGNRAHDVREQQPRHEGSRRVPR